MKSNNRWFFLLILASSPCWAETYRCVMPDGKQVYSDRPCPENATGGAMGEIRHNVMDMSESRVNLERSALAHKEAQEKRQQEEQMEEQRQQALRAKEQYLIQQIEAEERHLQQVQQAQVQQEQEQQLRRLKNEIMSLEAKQLHLQTQIRSGW